MSILSPTEEEIKGRIESDHVLAKILVAISEEPCYKRELIALLNSSQETVGKALFYIDKVNLAFVFNSRNFEDIDEITEDKIVKSKIQNKIAKVTDKLNRLFASNIQQTITFYYISKVGENYLEFAKQCANKI